MNEYIKIGLSIFTAAVLTFQVIVSIMCFVAGLGPNGKPMLITGAVLMLLFSLTVPVAIWLSNV